MSRLVKSPDKTQSQTDRPADEKIGTSGSGSASGADALRQKSAGGPSAKPEAAGVPKADASKRKFRITFKNVPVVKLVYYGFGVLLVMLLVSGISSFNAFGNLNTAFNDVTQNTTPIVINAGKLEKNINVSHKSLVEILTSKNPEQIAELTKQYNAQNLIFKQSLEEFTALVADQSKYTELIEDLNAHLKKYEEYTGSIARDYLDQVIQREKVNKEISSFRALVTLYSEEYNNVKAIMKEEDDFVHQLMLAPEPLKGMMVTNTDAALSSEDLAFVEDTLKKNRNAVKMYMQQIDEIKRNLPTFENDLGRYYKNFAVSVSDDAGVLAVHLNLVKEQTELKKTTLKANEELNALSQIIAAMSGISNEEMNLAVSGAYKTMQSSYIKISLVTLVGVIAALLVAYVVGQVINVPLSRLVKSINAMAEGDMTVPVRFNARSELGYLAKKLNALIESFGGTMRNIGASASRLQENAHDNSESMNSTAEKIKLQQQETVQIVNSINMMRASADNVAESAETSLHRIIEVNDAAETGRKIMSDNITTNHELANRLKKTSETVMRVSNMSDSIGSIVEVIKSIAEQTNLLALNAAIESARAGEHGRGFAVVADEVRNLAQKTATSTSEVQKLIEELQSAVSMSVTTIKDCEKEMDHSVMQTSAVNSSIEEIKAILTTINDMAHQIASAAEEQRCTSNEVANNVSRISELSELNAKEIEKAKDSCLSLDSLATQQRGMVEKFKY